MFANIIPAGTDNIEAEIKTLKVSDYVSLVAEISEIRKHVVKIQK